MPAEQHDPNCDIERCRSYPVKHCDSCSSDVCFEHFDVELAKCVDCASIERMHAAVSGSGRI